jgi:hypothetical protein
MSSPEPLVWYAAYASNLLARRFALYLQGGVLAETGRVHAGARDPRPPLADVPLELPGTVYFATEASTWPGTGRALYDPGTLLPGGSAGRGYLITAGQFADVVAQEMRREPGAFSGAVIPSAPGGQVVLGPGHYETLSCEGLLGGWPVVTMAAPWGLGDVPLLPLAGPYRDVITGGLRETCGWDAGQAEAYLAGLPGGAPGINPVCPRREHEIEL